MFNVRFACAATVLAVVTLSCGGNSPGSFPSSPATPTPITAFSERAVADERISRQGRELDDINTATALSLTLSGIVTDKAYPTWKISGATVTVTPSSSTTRTGSTGQYTLRRSAGTYTIKVAKSGYTTALIKRSIWAKTTVNVALAPVKPAGATARCKDRTWSKSQNRSGTCSWHKGVAYWVCPGKLCR